MKEINDFRDKKCCIKPFQEYSCRNLSLKIKYVLTNIEDKKELVEQSAYIMTIDSNRISRNHLMTNLKLFKKWYSSLA